MGSMQDTERTTLLAMCASSLSFSVLHGDSVRTLSNVPTSASDGGYSIERADPLRRYRSGLRVVRGAA